MPTYIHDPILYSIELLILQNIPYYNPDNDHLSWELYSRKAGNNSYEFHILGREEMFGRKLLARSLVTPKRRMVYLYIFKYVSESQRELLVNAFNEIASRIPQIPIIKEQK